MIRMILIVFFLSTMAAAQPAQTPVNKQTNATQIPRVVEAMGFMAQIINMASSGYSIYYLFAVKNTEAIAWKALGLGVVTTILNLPYVFYLNDPVVGLGALWGTFCLGLTMYAKYLYTGHPVLKVDAGIQTE